MTVRERKHQLVNRAATAGMIAVAVLLILCTGKFLNIQNTTYAIQSDIKTEGNYYKYVTERTEKAIYAGKIKGINTFYTEDGNAWGYSGKFKKGKTYILKMHNNGTKNNIKDDVIISIKEK